ncbi:MULTISPECIES: hypothetical protein [Microcystis]|uniref:hypothetical protein n=1 Tax=Microcystis TaxID=1125 RepID=UPI00086ECD75|nr:MULTISPECIES: hypothetical protein [Microcystis]MDB9385848.1 hypothetical protein [Microcystis aeruginosa CS-583]ODV35415.1 hypothetical protein BFG60_5187 [Microcystis aeruginosa NIES-98]
MAKKDGNYSYLKRQANRRQPREIFLIVCEGEKTRQFKNETHQPQELTKKGSSGTV